MSSADSSWLDDLRTACGSTTQPGDEVGRCTSGAGALGDVGVCAVRTVTGPSARDYDLRLVPCRPSSALLDRLDPPLLASSSPMIARSGLSYHVSSERVHAVGFCPHLPHLVIRYVLRSRFTGLQVQYVVLHGTCTVSTLLRTPYVPVIATRMLYS